MSMNSRTPAQSLDADVAPAWIVANFVSMSVAGVLMLAAFLLRSAMDVTAADTSFTAKAVFVAFEIFIALLYMALYARMTGVVLRRIVPDLPQRGWLAVHLAIGAIMGIALGLLMLEPDSDEPIDWANEESAVIASVLVLCGVLFGAALGGMQAAVLRRVADGTRFWITMSAAMMGIVTLVAIASLLLGPVKPTLASGALSSIVFTIIGTIAAAIMLPALRRLRPRHRDVIPTA